MNMYRRGDVPLVLVLEEGSAIVLEVSLRKEDVPIELELVVASGSAERL